MKIRVLFMTPLLAGTSGNKELMTDYQASRHPEGLQQDELDSVPLDETIEKGSTVFPKDEKGIFMWDYQWKGFLKEAIQAVYHLTDGYTKEYMKKHGIHPYLFRKTVDKIIHITPRKTYLTLPETTSITVNERPLRGQTMQGERICLSRSEQAEAGTVTELEIQWDRDGLGEIITECLNYGIKGGTLQWRGGGFGRFQWKEVETFNDSRIRDQELIYKPASIW